VFRNRKKEILLAIATTLLSSIAGLILIETYYLSSRYSSVCEICQFHPQLGWETIPSKTVSNKKVTYTTNSLGMRSGEVDKDKGHILLVGDSVTFGLGVNNNETISHYLARENREFQILNLGVPGYGIGQYFLNLKRHIDKLNTKLIVLIIYTSNDLDETRKDTRYGISKPFFHYQDGDLIYHNPKISKYSCSNIYSRSRIVKHLIPNFIINQCKSKVIEINKASRTIAKLIDEIRILGLKKNISTLIVLSPSLTAVEWVDCRGKIGRVGEDIDLCRDLDPGFETYYNYFSKMMDLYQLPYIDFLEDLVAYNKQKEIKHLYNDNGKDIHHYSPQGNLLLAKAIAKRIKVTSGGKITLNEN